MVGLSQGNTKGSMYAKWVGPYNHMTYVMTRARFGLSRTDGITVDISRDGITVDISRDGITGYLKGWDNCGYLKGWDNWISQGME